MTPLPFDLREAWPAPSPDARFRARVVDASLRERSFASSKAVVRFRRVIVGVILGGVGAAAALSLPERPALGGDALPTHRARKEPSVRTPMVWPLHAPAYAERERATRRAVTPRRQEKTPWVQEKMVTHYPLCGCSSGAIVCSCVEP